MHESDLQPVYARNCFTPHQRCQESVCESKAAHFELGAALRGSQKRSASACRWIEPMDRSIETMALFGPLERLILILYSSLALPETFLCAFFAQRKPCFLFFWPPFSHSFQTSFASPNLTANQSALHINPNQPNRLQVHKFGYKANRRVTTFLIRLGTIMMILMVLILLNLQVQHTIGKYHLHTNANRYSQAKLAAAPAANLPRIH